jgi:Tol biopolymer transport system component
MQICVAYRRLVMSRKVLFGFLMAFVFIFSNFCKKEKNQEFLVLKGPYLGQPPPGNNPEIFAPGIVSTERKEFMYGFFNEGSLFFFESSIPDSEMDWINIPVYRTEIKNGKWTKTQKWERTGRPWIYSYSGAPKDTKIFFAWKKNLDGTGPSMDIDIWKAVMLPDGWSLPERLSPPVNTEKFDSWPSLSEKETLYFFSSRDGGSGKLDLYCSVLQDGEYREVENLGEDINSEEHDHDPFIDPAESYLLWCSNRPGGYGGNDLYIAFRKNDGKWTKPINLGKKINTAANETRPYVTADGKYLFFVSDTNSNLDIFWVDASVLDQLKPDTLDL